MIPRIKESKHIAACGIYLAARIAPTEFHEVAPNASTQEAAMAFVVHGISGLVVAGCSDQEILAACQDTITWWKDRA